MQTISRTMGASQWTSLTVLSLLWGGSFFFVEIAVTSLPPFTIVLVRVALAALALHALLLATGAPLRVDMQLWGTFLVMGFLNNVVPFSLLVWGQTQIASGLASILNATTPIFTVLVAHALTRDEKLSAGRLAGVLLGLAGVTVMIGPAALAGIGSNLLAQVACLRATLSYAFAGVFGRRFARLGVSATQSAAGQVSASTLILLPVVLLLDRPWTLPVPEPQVLAALAALAILSTAVAYVLFFRILASAGATNIMLVTLLVPVTAILLGTAFLDERLNGEHFAGIALIAFGLAAIDGRPAALLTRRLAGRAG